VLVEMTEEQSLFRETTVRFVEAELPLAATRKLHDDPAGFDRSWFVKTAELGWFALLAPGELGGGTVSERGLLDAVLVADVLGRFVQPGPFVPMNVVVTALARHAGERLRAELVPRLVAGEAVATWAFADVTGTVDDGRGVSVTALGAHLRLDGVRGFVQDAAFADQLLVTATFDGEAVQVLVPASAAGVSMEPLTSLDLSRRFAHVRFEGVVIREDDVVRGGVKSLEAQLQIAIVLNLAETVGAMEALFEMTVAYAKDRIAFGRPIGSFQAIKHLLADDALHLESCKAVVVAAAEAVAGADPAASEVVSIAAAFVGDQSHELAQDCLQVHGGIGYTWEHDLHLFLRRIQSNAALYGTPSWHRERICDFHGLGQEIPA
jgi:alkylation response protein AidB-like acyl-CoA dehydrogenase